MSLNLSLPREERELLERQILSPLASPAERSKGRARNETECDVRTCYQRDIDRITYSKSFRRLKHKTQVFLQPEGDHYSTRLTHTLEVARISRTIARALKLNEDLTEAVALGHDLGHTPFGHAGESALDLIMSRDGKCYNHNDQSLRVVEKLERGGKGINLTYEVRNGIACHTGKILPETPEAQVVRLADRIAYVNHDLDDAIRAGILCVSDIPPEIVCAFGITHPERVNVLVMDVISESGKKGEVGFSTAVSSAFDIFRNFMFENVYRNMKAKGEESKVYGILKGIYDYYIEHQDKLPEFYLQIASQDGLQRAVVDYVSGMTDKFAVDIYEKLFIPEAWQVR